MVSTTLRVGPTHGVQLSANSTPSSGAPASPARGRNEGRAIRPVTGNRSNTPANSRPSTMVSAAQHLGQPGRVPLQHQPEAAEGQPFGGEHEREAEHEQQRAEQGAAAAARRRRGAAGGHPRRPARPR